MEFEVQDIGLDVGRGFVKGYTEVNGEEKSCKFKSVIAAGRQLEFSDNKDNIFISGKLGEEVFENKFCGILAEKEGYTSIRNAKDSKVTQTVKVLILAAINKLSEKPFINIMLGVPHREFNRRVLKEVEEAYKGKTIEVTDHITGKVKKVIIRNISIFRESDAALLYQVTFNKPGNNKDNVMVNIGFRTTEISYYDCNLEYNDLKSESEELGNKTVLEFVKNYHPKKKLEEIDTDTIRYNDLKNQGYVMLAEKIEQEVESFIVNLDEVNLYVCGGLVETLELSDIFIKTKDPQMITSKGLFLICNRRFNKM